MGGPLALVKNGDPITIDAEKRELTLGISEAEMKARQEVAGAQPRYTRGVLARYAHTVTPASLGAVTDLGLKV